MKYKFKALLLAAFLSAGISLESGTSNQFRLKDLPEEIIKYCSDFRGKIADTDEMWNPGCNVIDSLPSSRIVRAIRIGDRWKISYEKGGIAVITYDVDFVLENGKWVKGGQIGYDD